MLVDGVSVEVQSVGSEREVGGADKRELFCTVHAEEESEESRSLEAVEESEESTSMESGPMRDGSCEAVEVMFYYERPPDYKGNFNWRVGAKMDIHNGWWEDGRLVVDDR